MIGVYKFPLNTLLISTLLVIFQYLEPYRVRYMLIPFLIFCSLLITRQNGKIFRRIFINKEDKTKTYY